MSEIGRQGGRQRTTLQQQQRRKNILKALAKRWPRSVKIQQELKKLEAECDS